MTKPSKLFVSVYLVDRAYGGPEEGGWYYDCGELVRVVRMFTNEAKAERFCRRLNSLLRATLNKGRREISSVLSEGCYAAEVHGYDGEVPPKFYPEQRPYYE